MAESKWVAVVHNYIFVEKTLEETELRSKLAECGFPLSLMMNKGSKTLTEISDHDMVEFRLLCEGGDGGPWSV